MSGRSRSSSAAIRSLRTSFRFFSAGCGWCRHPADSTMAAMAASRSRCSWRSSASSRRISRSSSSRQTPASGSHGRSPPPTSSVERSNSHGEIYHGSGAGLNRHSRAAAALKQRQSRLQIRKVGAMTWKSSLLQRTIGPCRFDSLDASVSDCDRSDGQQEASLMTMESHLAELERRHRRSRRNRGRAGPSGHGYADADRTQAPQAAAEGRDRSPEERLGPLSEQRRGSIAKRRGLPAALSSCGLAPRICAKTPDHMTARRGQRIEKAVPRR